MNAVKAKFIRELFDKLDERKVGYLILRGYEGLPENPGRDIDVFIGRQEGALDSFRRAIEDCGFTAVEKCSFDGFATFACFHAGEKGASSVQIDVWTKLCWRGICWCSEEELVKDARDHNGFTVPSLGAEAAVTSLKELFGRGKVKEKYYEKLRSQVAAEPEKYAACLKPALGELADEAKNHCLNGDFSKLDGMAKRIKARLRKNDRRTWLGATAKRVKERLLGDGKHRGMLVAFAGPDGSGKTTVIEKERELFDPLFAKVTVYHMRYRILPELRTGHGFSSMKGALAPEGEQKADGAENKPQKRSFISKLASWAVVLYYTLEFMLGNHRIRRARRRNELVLYDRYYYDHFIQPTTRELIYPFRKLLLGLVVSPDVAIHLNADPMAVFARKQELRPEEIAKQNECIARIMKDVKRSETVDTGDLSPDEVAKKVFEMILAAKLEGDAKRAGRVRK